MRALSLLFIAIAAVQVACTREAQEKLQQSRLNTNEASTIATLRIIASGEMVYAAACTNGGFAVSLPDLAKPSKDGTSFVPADLGAGATISRAGYRVTLSKDAAPDVTAKGTAAETCNGSTNPPASSFFASAEPEKPGETGRRYFAVDGRGTVFASTSPIANPIVPSPTVTPLQ